MVHALHVVTAAGGKQQSSRRDNAHHRDTAAKGTAQGALVGSHVRKHLVWSVLF
ncbi:hypothetical protein STRIP9103_09305 [Streptomyces ipomoeae 91-03]|uniref:Uncharacterized protein n=1 Tax=Streptomyces ipomoeae 91-03 TaxID=698759 RepID=L1KRM9_9ACTN|nr:hypothetical protein STRIP9103_09305 [Streptomyces ipomoeae 91-03]